MAFDEDDIEVSYLVDGVYVGPGRSLNNAGLPGRTHTITATVMHKPTGKSVSATATSQFVAKSGALEMLEEMVGR